MTRDGYSPVSAEAIAEFCMSVRRPSPKLSRELLMAMEGLRAADRDAKGRVESLRWSLRDISTREATQPVTA